MKCYLGGHPAHFLRKRKSVSRREVHPIHLMHYKSRIQIHYSISMVLSPTHQYCSLFRFLLFEDQEKLRPFSETLKSIRKPSKRSKMIENQVELRQFQIP